MRFAIVYLVPLISLVSGICQNPRITSSSHSTQDAFFHQSTAFVTEFILKCQNDLKSLSLYADVNGNIVPVAQAPGSSKYSVSWVSQHKKATAGDYKIRIFDEEQLSALKKAVRNNEDTTNLNSLGSVTLNHPGLSKGPIISSEVVAMSLASIVLYFAYSWKSSLLA